MGNGSVVVVLGFITLFGIININFNSRSAETVDNVTGYAKYALARDIAQSAVHILLRKVDTTSVLPSSFSISGNLHDGTYEVDATTSGDTMWLVSRGYMMDSLYTIRATLLRYPKPFPGSAFKAALGLYPSPVGFTMKGMSARIDGRDHDSTGALLPPPRVDVPAVLVRTPSDSTTVYNGADSPDSMLQGSQKIAVDPNIDNPADFVDELIAQADYSYITPVGTHLTIGATTWGSANDPKIVFVDARDTNMVKFAANSTGWGILVVKGSIEVTGTLNWNGLVIAYATTVIDFKTSGGNSTILGSFLFGGAPNSDFTMKGTGQILYSKQTLNKAKNVNKLLAYSIIDWYE